MSHAGRAFGTPVTATPYAVTPQTWDAAYAAGREADAHERPAALLGALAVTAVLALLALAVWSGLYAPRLSAFSGGGSAAATPSAPIAMELDVYNGGLLTERDLRASIDGAGVTVVHTQVATGALAAHQTTRVTVTVQVTDCAAALRAAQEQRLAIVLSGHRPWGWMASSGALADPLGDLVTMTCDPSRAP